MQIPQSQPLIDGTKNDEQNRDNGRRETRQRARWQ